MMPTAKFLKKILSSNRSTTYTFRIDEVCLGKKMRGGIVMVRKITKKEFYIKSLSLDHSKWL